MKSARLGLALLVTMLLAATGVEDLNAVGEVPGHEFTGVSYPWR